MDGLQKALFHKIMRCPLWRLPAFMLLGLALLGYGGLPASPPLTPHFFRAVFSAAAQVYALPNGRFQPMQAKERRSREVLAEMDTLQPKELSSSAFATKALEFAVPLRHATAVARSGTEMPFHLAISYFSQAPPALQMI
ncbi:hypothetical protein [Chelativorans sp. Marseille-P2723]|uniref:hypothetical protein n=1 Tax=Chelativorans sp. Marseille-P2723 TaxID=2709133 RepID=UPI00156DBBD0|nr:hypothetical protein [Chelativorans sp. Marseille-P2723]